MFTLSMLNSSMILRRVVPGGEHQYLFMIALYYRFTNATNAPDTWRYYIRLTPPRALRSIPVITDRLHLQEGHLRLMVETLPQVEQFWSTYNHYPTLRLDNAYQVELYRWRAAIDVPGKRTTKDEQEQLVTTLYWVILPYSPQMRSIELPAINGVVDLRAHPTIFNIVKVETEVVTETEEIVEGVPVVTTNTSMEPVEYTLVDNALTTPDTSYRHRLLVPPDLTSVRIEYKEPTAPTPLCPVY
jgi:hypothetical protein